MIIGFTGTRRGMAYAQCETLLAQITGLGNIHPIRLAVHGDSGKADAQFDGLCKNLGITRHARPGYDAKGNSPHAAHCDTEHRSQPQPYMVRNRRIVNTTEVLLACPHGPEELRSGTWATVRMARQAHHPLLVIAPSGRIIEMSVPIAWTVAGLKR